MLGVEQGGLGDQQRHVLVLRVVAAVLVVQLLANRPWFSSKTTKCEPERAFH